jgi:hypothetical protein
VPSTKALLRDFRHELLAAGIPLFWWTDVPYAPNDGGLFAATQLAGVNGYITNPASLAFGAAQTIAAPEQAEIERTAGVTLPATGMRRGEVAAWLVKQLQL